MRLTPLLFPLAALAACSETPTNTADAAVEGSGGAIANLAPEPAEPDFDNALNAIATSPDWLGRWTGVEGTYLVVTAGTAPGSYKLEMQYTLDDKGTFDGTAAGEGIAFSRPDGIHTLRHSNGDATGLKYLAGKQDCVTVKPGEGYCRD